MSTEGIITHKNKYRGISSVLCTTSSIAEEAFAALNNILILSAYSVNERLITIIYYLVYYDNQYGATHMYVVDMQKMNTNSNKV